MKLKKKKWTPMMHETKQRIKLSTVSQDISCLSRQSYMNATIGLNKTTKVDIGVGKN